MLEKGTMLEVWIFEAGYIVKVVLIPGLTDFLRRSQSYVVLYETVSPRTTLPRRTLRAWKFLLGRMLGLSGH